MQTSPEAATEFERHRPRLFGIAYRMLGIVADAEDMVQEAYLKWHETDRSAIRVPEAWLVSVTTRLSIDRLRRSATERRAYVGDWLPEPIVSGASPDPGHPTSLAAELSTAFMVLLERLAPDERAAFLLREVFDTDYAEIARVLEKSEAACRQIVHRARGRVREGRPRFTADPRARERLLRRFLDALETEDSDALLGVLAPDVVCVTDAGGKVTAARRVIVGRDRVARLLIVGGRKFGPLEHRLVSVNGDPGIAVHRSGRLLAIVSIDGDEGRISAFYRVFNPEKLHRVEEAFRGAPPA